MAQQQRGIDCRQAGPLLFDASFISSATGLPVTTGTATCQLFEVESDGTLLPFDFSTNAFLANNGIPVTATISLTSRGTGTGPTASGYWSALLATTTGLTAGGIYLIVYATVPATAAPYTMRKIQWGLAEGDLAIAAGGKVAGVVLVDTLTTYTGNTPQTGDLFGVVNPMVTSHVFTTAALANAPTGGSAPSAATIATAVWTDLLASSDFSTVLSIGALLKANPDTAGTTAILASINASQTTCAVVGTPTQTAITVSGLSQAKSYVGMQFELTSGVNAGTRQTITAQANSGSNLTLTVGAAFGAVASATDTGSVF